jgi:hypothetical protein
VKNTTKEDMPTTDVTLDIAIVGVKDSQQRRIHREDEKDSTLIVELNNK